jgi:transglutaminase-like putative cysteine protease
VPAQDRSPDALLPVWAARLVGFAALASLGALEWQRLVAGLSSGRALVWVAAATAAGAAVLACDRLPVRWREAGTVAAAIAGLLAAVVVSGIDLDLLRPRNWGTLVDGIVGGAQSLGTVRLPYDGTDPWPRAALQLLGACLLTLAALLSCWPRVHGRGYPFLALASLLVLVASPVVSLGGARPLVLGAAIAALTVCFLWLERLPLRPGVGVAALLGVALAGALPLAAVADRGEPWFDYRSFAEGLGPDDPVRFSWAQGYGPIDWPRDGNEVMRVRSEEPYYWKSANLAEFDGRGWVPAPLPERGGEDPELELRDDWHNEPGWRDRIEVSVRRLRTRDVPAPGTVMGVERATRPVEPSGEPGRWRAASELQRGDSYTADVYVPRPSAAELREADTSGFRDRRVAERTFTVPFLEGREPTERELGGATVAPVRSAVVHLRPFGESQQPYVTYPSIGRTRHGIRAVDDVLARSPYRRTWALARRLRAGAETPYEYVLAIDRFLQDGFSYSERPTPPAPGRAPLDAFLNDGRDGYCQHFAGAMALLLRMGGVPARVAAGFSPGGFSKRRDAWIVRDTDAHVWVEAWFDRHGWVTFDPTPSSTPARSQIAALEAAPPPAAPGTAESAEARGGGRPATGPGGLRADLARDVDPTDGPAQAASAAGGGVPWWGWALGALAAAAAGCALALVRRRRRVGPQTAHDRAIAELEAALRRSGRPAEPSITLRQLEQRLGTPEATAYLRALSAGRYGAGAELPTPAQRRALRRALAQGLGPTGRLRALWALPPRPR